MDYLSTKEKKVGKLSTKISVAKTAIEDGKYKEAYESTLF